MVAPTSFFADYGCHVRILEEALVLQALGNRVTICTYHNGRDIAGLDTRRTLPIPWRKDYEVGSSRHKIGLDALLLPKVLSTALQVRPDVIHGHLHEGALIGFAAAKALRLPLVFDFQGSLTGEMLDHRFLASRGRAYHLWRWLETKIDQLPSAIITSSQHAASLLQSEFNCPEDKISIIADCVNADSFAPSQYEGNTNALKASLGIPPDHRLVVYLGLLAEWQGTGLLLEAARQLVARRPNVQFLVMGFPSVDAYRAQARRLGLNGHVTFTGQVPYQQAPSLLGLGDVAVAPKISATEGSGKLLNYMAMGLPIVAFDVPVSREYLGDLGVYARPGDASSLEQLIATVAAATTARRLEDFRRTAAAPDSFDATTYSRRRAFVAIAIFAAARPSPSFEPSNCRAPLTTNMPCCTDT